MTRLRDRGIRLDGEEAGDHFGIRPSMPGDVTDDGLPDVLAASFGERIAGTVHVVSHRMLL